MPQRIQLRRAKGWRLPEGAIVVSRPSKFGNPWRVKREGVVLMLGTGHGTRKVVLSTGRGSARVCRARERPAPGTQPGARAPGAPVRYRTRYRARR